jgi:hypothetical protein
MLNSQEQWRKDPKPFSVDIAALGDNNSCWLLLLMTEDEIDRAKSSFFRIVHPIASTVCHYLPLYKNPRFSDHLLAKWILGDMSNTLQNRRIIPKKFKSPKIVVENVKLPNNSQNETAPIIISPRMSSTSNRIQYLTSPVLSRSRLGSPRQFMKDTAPESTVSSNGYMNDKSSGRNMTDFSIALKVKDKVTLLDSSSKCNLVCSSLDDNTSQSNQQNESDNAFCENLMNGGVDTNENTSSNRHNVSPAHRLFSPSKTSVKYDNQCDATSQQEFYAAISKKDFTDSNEGRLPNPFSTKVAKPPLPLAINDVNKIFSPVGRSRSANHHRVVSRTSSLNVSSTTMNDECNDLSMHRSEANTPRNVSNTRNASKSEVRVLHDIIFISHSN